MATRSHIGVENHKEGTVDYIYCHWDGYPKHVGKVLTEYYQDMDRVNALMKLGDLSSLGPEIGEKQYFYDKSTHNQNWCLAYKRDRNEPDALVNVKTTQFADLFKDDNVDYVYVFDGEFWNCYDTHTKKYINLYHE
jgi:hypothetical protein